MDGCKGKKNKNVKERERERVEYRACLNTPTK
jgi:hypothetical protein